MLVFDVEEKLHDVDINLQGLSGLLRVIGFLIGWFLLSSCRLALSRLLRLLAQPAWRGCKY